MFSCSSNEATPLPCVERRRLLMNGGYIVPICPGTQVEGEKKGKKQSTSDRRGETYTSGFQSGKPSPFAPNCQPIDSRLPSMPGPRSLVEAHTHAKTGWSQGY